MGAIYDIGKLITDEQVQKNVSDNVKRVYDNFGKVNAITKMAKDAVQTYPVIVSEGVVANNEDLIFAVCNYLETQYSVFTMIAMGMDPVFEGTNARDHILKFYSQESDEYISGCKSNATINISKEKITSSLEYLKPYENDDNRGNLKDNNDVNKKTESKNLPSISLKNQKLEQKARMSDPTIINVKLKMAENKHEIEFPLAIKAVPRFITTDESSQIFSYLKEDKPISILIKLLSGEISLFKDVIFQLERAKKDKELYSRLGRHPWFRQLLIRKNTAGIVGFLKSFFSTKKEVNVLPICSLVVTKDELENGYGDIWDKIKKKEEENILDKLMLLSLVVVDTVTSVVEFSFYGLKNNTIIRSDSLIKEVKGGKDGKDVENLLKTLVYKL